MDGPTIPGIVAIQLDKPISTPAYCKNIDSEQIDNR